MVTIIPGFEKSIADNLTLRIASTPEEGDLLAKFNAEIHDPAIEEYVKRLYHECPQKKEHLWFYIIDRSNNQVVSSAALLPFIWKIGEHEINIAEMGFVGTLPTFRGQGLFGIINDYYEAAVQERKLVISALVGIPNFYRKYGYSFALERFSGFSVATNSIPTETYDEVKIRKATPDDLNDIEKYYLAYYSQFGVSTVFDKEMFQFRYMNNTCDEYNSITYIVEEDRKTRGFFTIGSIEDPNIADIILTSELSHSQIIKTLQFVKIYNRGTIDAFQVHTHQSTMFAKYLRNKGSILINSWSWQLRILDMQLFFDQFKPILEDRIENSIFKGLTKNVTISNYNDTYSFQFESGKISAIEIIREFPGSDVDLRIPSPFDVRLFLSDRNVAEIKYIVNDTLVKPESLLLIETMFPTLPSLLFSYF